MQGLGVLDDEIGAMLVVYNLAKARLDLLGDVEVVEDGHLAVVSLHDTYLVGCNE